MSRLEKLKQKLRSHPRSVRFEELVRVLRALGYEETRSRGSHHVFRPSGSGPSLLIIRPHGGRKVCALVDVEKVITRIEEEENHEES